MGNSPLPVLTTGGYILMRSFLSIVGLLTLPHGVELESTFGLKLRSVKS